MECVLVHYQHTHRCVLSDTCLSLPLPCFSCRGLSAPCRLHFQAPVPLASVWVWPQRVTGWDTRGKGAGGSPLFTAVSPAVSCLLIPSFTRTVPRVLASLGPSSRKPQLCACSSALGLWLPAFGSFWAPHCPVWLLSSFILCATISQNLSLSLKYAGGLLPG